MSEISEIDYTATALSRITQQYKDKPKYVALVQGLAALVEDNLETPAANLFDVLDIEKMGGDNLDVIGRIVGQSRVLIDYDQLEFFGFDGATNAGTFGSVHDTNIGERFVSVFEDAAGEKTLSDPEYRTFIKARILKNYSDGTAEDLIESIKALLDVEQVRISENPETDNYIQNGDFSSGTDGWTLFTGEGAAATFAVVSGELKTTPTVAGSSIFNIRPQTDSAHLFSLSGGKSYTLSIDLYADAAKTLQVFIYDQENSVLNEEQPVTTTKTTYEHTFTVDNAGEYQLLVCGGLDTTPWYIDNVSIPRGEDMTLNVGVLGNLTTNQLNLIQNYDIIPRPTGVNIAEVDTYSLLKFNGEGTKIDFSSTSDFDIGSSDFEIRTKIKTTNPNQVILSKEDDANHSTASYSLFIESGTVQFGYSPSDGTYTVFDSGFQIIDNLIHSVVILKSGSALTISVDGQSSLHAMYSSPFTGDDDFLKIGRASLNKEDFTYLYAYNAGTSSVNTTYFEADNTVGGRRAFVHGDGIRQISWNETTLEWAFYNNSTPLYSNSGGTVNPDRSGWTTLLGESPSPVIEYNIPYSGIIFDTSIKIDGTIRGKWLLTDSSGTTAEDLSGNGNDGTITDGEWVTTLG